VRLAQGAASSETYRPWRLAVLIAAACAAVANAAAQPTDADVLERLERLERNQANFERELAARDARIRELETQIGALSATPSATQSAQPAADALPEARDVAPAVAGVAPATEEHGRFQPGGAGFKLADTRFGDVNFSAWAYTRFLNQTSLDETYTDSFGRTRTLDLRNDLQLNKVNLYFKGWLFDPRFRYLLYTWTANTSQGDNAQVVVAGSLSYRVSDKVDVGFGIGGLPGTRSLRGTFPYWNKVDTRPMADEFFRPSYTTGVWASGELGADLHYKVMVGNNLSQLGVNAAQLDDQFNTVSAGLWWMPGTGEFGPAGGYGDFEYHENAATTFGWQFTRSREDRQSQPDTEGIENSQIRLSDGTVIFQPDAFATGGRINRATYLMSSLDAGWKYRGLAVEGEYYFRRVDDFEAEGLIPVEELHDHGYQLQASMMVVPRKLQTYLALSKVFGEYGDPRDLAVGVNWFPLRERLLRVNAELLYLKNSPVGYSSVPFVVGGNGTMFYANLEMLF
jgi:hypothetical protein